jgi:hypothetical protein
MKGIPCTVKCLVSGETSERTRKYWNCLKVQLWPKKKKIFRYDYSIEVRVETNMNMRICQNKWFNFNRWHQHISCCRLEF